MKKLKLNVYYDDIKKTFEGDNPFRLIRIAREDKLYDLHRTVTFEFEEVKDGDKCSEC